MCNLCVSELSLRKNGVFLFSGCAGLLHKFELIQFTVPRIFYVNLTLTQSEKPRQILVSKYCETPYLKNQVSYIFVYGSGDPPLGPLQYIPINKVGRHAYIHFYAHAHMKFYKIVPIV
jgi:hypothetical protein